MTNYTPMYRETSGVGKRKLMTMDEVLRMDVDRALIIIRGKNVLEVDKYDYSKHPEAKKLRAGKAASHVPAWQTARNQKQAGKKKEVKVDRPKAPAEPVPAPPQDPPAPPPAKKAEPQVVKATKNSILKPKSTKEE